MGPHGFLSSPRQGETYRASVPSWTSASIPYILVLKKPLRFHRRVGLFNADGMIVQWICASVAAHHIATGRASVQHTHGKQVVQIKLNGAGLCIEDLQLKPGSYGIARVRIGGATSIFQHKRHHGGLLAR